LHIQTFAIKPFLYFEVWRQTFNWRNDYGHFTSGCLSHLNEFGDIKQSMVSPKNQSRQWNLYTASVQDKLSQAPGTNPKRNK